MANITRNIPLGAAVVAGAAPTATLGINQTVRPPLGAAVVAGLTPKTLGGNLTYTARVGRADVTIANVVSSGAITTSRATIAPNDISGLYTALDVSSITGATTVSLVVKLQRLDHLSGNWIDISDASYAAKTATGTDDLILYPGVAETSNRSVSDHPSGRVRMVGTLTNASAGTVNYSLSGRWLK
jgi:hypothetical protein